MTVEIRASLRSVPRTPPRSVRLRATALPSGGIDFSSSSGGRWTASARTTHDVTRVVRGAFTGALGTARPGPAARPERLHAVPELAHQVRHVALTVERIDGGRLRFSTPQARGWAYVAGNPGDVVRALTAAFAEAQLASYSAWRGERTELDVATSPVPGDPMAPPRRPVPGQRRRRGRAAQAGWGTGQFRPDTYLPEQWAKLPDGRWKAPGGRVYRAETQMVQRVIARRTAAGLAS